MLKKMLFLIFQLSCAIVISQNQKIEGILISEHAKSVLQGVSVTIENSLIEDKSNEKGVFSLELTQVKGEQVVVFNKPGFLQKRLPLVITQSIDLGIISLSEDFTNNQNDFATIDLSAEQLQISETESENQILLQANKDAFLSSVSFNWGASFFKIRGLGSEYSRVLINGVAMNTFRDQRPNWSNWSGLNDMLRSKEFTVYVEPNSQDFGGLIGTNQFLFNANAFTKGTKLSLTSTNRTYQGRVMLTHHSGKSPKGWAYSFSASTSRAKQGYIEGTTLKSYSILASIEKEINSKNNLNLTALYTPVERGKASANTNEVIKIKENQYNSYWGNQNDKIRNSRVRKVKMPIFTLNHYWQPSLKLDIQNNVLFQKGINSNSRLDYTGKEIIKNNGQIFFEGSSRNPDPSYYQRLPSYFLRFAGREDYRSAFLATEQLKNKGQIDWNALYLANQNSKGNSNYVLYEDVIDDTFFVVNSIWDYRVSPKFNIQGKIAYSQLKSHNYAKLTDLLGGTGYLDVDGFKTGIQAQNNVQTPNRIVGTGNIFKYNYELLASKKSSFIQANYSFRGWETFTAISLGTINYQRKGLYENGSYLGSASLGKSPSISKTVNRFKIGATKSITNKIYVSGSLLIGETPPTLQQSFTNPRQNNSVVIDLRNEKQLATDLGVHYQYGKVKTRFSAYHIQRSNSTQVSFFFSENIAGLGRSDNAGFLQEITTGINTQNTGLEFGAEISVTSTLTLNASLAIAKHIYSNNPNLYLTSDAFEAPIQVGQSALKNYHLPVGPQQAYGLGFNYRDPSYWWFSTQLNYLRKSFINISPFTRTQSFATDIDGQPLLDYDEVRARELLTQEEFPAYFLWNAIGGKSWKVNNKYLGVTLGVQNILNQIFKTGGYEQSRNSNYRDLNEDQSRAQPIFGSKYWQGYGTTFYVNTYLRF